jgi:hypothetical protein
LQKDCASMSLITDTIPTYATTLTVSHGYSMKITYIPTLGAYKLEMKGYDFTPHYTSRDLAITHGLQLISYYNSLNQ